MGIRSVDSERNFPRPFRLTDRQTWDIKMVPVSHLPQRILMFRHQVETG